MSEKLETVISRNVTNTRMRDFYDIYILQKLYGEQLSKDVLWDALVATAKKRETLEQIEVEDIDEVFNEIQSNSVMENLWKAYQKNYTYATDISWHSIMKSIRTLYEIISKNTYNLLQFPKNAEKPNDGTTKQGKEFGESDAFEALLKNTEGLRAEPDGSPKYDLDVYEVHKLDVDGSGRDRTVLCKGEGCELCKAGIKSQLRMFLQMVNLDEKDKEKQLQLWERGITDIKQILGIIEEYGDLNARDIKIKRSGAKGSMKTTYQYFPKDKTERELPEKQNLVGSLILDLSPEDQIKAIEGRLEVKKNNNNEGGGSSDGAGDSTRVF